MRRWFGGLLLVWLVGAGGCHSTVSLRVPEDEDLGVSAEDMAVTGDLATVEGDMGGDVDSACTPTVTSCVGLCGPIFDPCLNKNVQCGACDDGGVCDLVTHTCGVPKVDCTALGAECGVIKNSCGTRLECPQCMTAKECNPDSNACVDCTNVTCEELGFECGRAWLGCGPRTDPASLVDCGGCGGGFVCNLFNHRCEPICTASAAATLCANAKAQLGKECGDITDGCGSTVNCGSCQAGFGCGAQGEANRCGPVEKPVECIAAGRNCGDLTSACGGTVHCGDCMAPDVCNPNGVCGPPCTPKNCIELGDPECGTVDDGCGAPVKCHDCPAPASDYTCLPNHTCCKKKKPADFPGQCGTQVDDGCGGKLDIPCASGTCTTAAPGQLGTCCVDNTSCGSSCNSTITNMCTMQSTACVCDAAHYCSSTTPGVAGMCQTRATCNSLGLTGAQGQQCSNGAAFDDGSGTLLACYCSGGRYCINNMTPPGTVVTGMNKGYCCTDTGCTTNGMQRCNVTSTNTCTGVSETCGGCPSNQFCNGSNLCQPLNTCSTYITNPGQVGSVCSNGANPAWPKGNGTNLSCPCSGGGVYCVDGSGNVVSGSTTGTCCKDNNTCQTDAVGKLCTRTNSCTGGTVNCCSSSEYCDNGGHCKPKNTCQSLDKGTGLNKACNDNTYYDDGAGNKFPCHCINTAPYTNMQCTGDASNKEGTCTCAASACADCSQDGTSDGCGGTKSCACTGGQVCYSHACCTKYDCTNKPPGVPGTSANPGCGTYNNGCGGSFPCGCPANNPTTGQPWSNVQCTLASGQTYGTCTCTPTPCTVLGAGTHANDGCGQAVDCGT